jgi:hypothetical protein
MALWRKNGSWFELSHGFGRWRGKAAAFGVVPKLRAMDLTPRYPRAVPEHLVHYCSAYV